MFNLSPTNFIKQSLAAHGKLIRNRNVTPSSGHRQDNRAYADWVDGRRTGRMQFTKYGDSPGIKSLLSETKRSKDYEKTMDHLRKRSIR